MSVSVVTVRALVTELARRDLPWEDLLEPLGLSEAALHDAEVRVDLSVFHALVERVFERAGDRSLGLEAGLRAPITTLRVIGPLMLASQNLRSAFEGLRRFLPLLVHGATWQLEESADSAVISYQSPHPGGAGSRFCAEFAFAMASRIGAALHGERGAIRSEVRFVHSAWRSDEAYVRAFGCPVYFGMADNAIVIPRARVDRTHLQSDASVLRNYEHAAEQLLHTLEGSRVDDRVRAFLREQREFGGLNQRVIALRLGYSARTLRRRLTDEGTSVTRLLDEARAVRASAELSVSEPSVKAVAARLGFASPQAFHRAFMRWNGKTPGAFARELEAGRALARSPSGAPGANPSRSARSQTDAARKRTA